MNCRGIPETPLPQATTATTGNAAMKALAAAMLLSGSGLGGQAQSPDQPKYDKNANSCVKSATATNWTSLCHWIWADLPCGVRFTQFV